MIEFLQNHWGALASLIGLFVSAFGLAWAIREARQAKTAAQAAERATRETRDRIARHLVAVDMERAVALIQRLKLLHDTERWERALEQYQTLRDMLSAIIARYPERRSDRRQRLIRARSRITDMEEQVRSRSQTLENHAAWDRELNDIQTDLEDMANSISLGE